MNLFDPGDIFKAAKRIFSKTKRSHRIGALFAILLCTGTISAETVSLDLGDGVKLDLVWVPVNSAAEQREIEIGDFTG